MVCSSELCVTCSMIVGSTLLVSVHFPRSHGQGQLVDCEELPETFGQFVQSDHDNPSLDACSNHVMTCCV